MACDAKTCIEVVTTEDYMITLDDKSGYWQMAMHPDPDWCAAIPAGTS